MGSGIKALYPQEYLDLPQAIINGPVNDKKYYINRLQYIVHRFKVYSKLLISGICARMMIPSTATSYQAQQNNRILYRKL